MNSCKSYWKLKINTIKDIEETQIRLKLKQDDMFKLEMLVAFRPDATLRQIKNTCIANKYASNNYFNE